MDDLQKKKLLYVSVKAQVALLDDLIGKFEGKKEILEVRVKELSDELMQGNKTGSE